MVSLLGQLVTLERLGGLGGDEMIIIELLIGSYWKRDQHAPAFDTHHDAIAYVCDHAGQYPHTRLRIGTHMYEFRTDGVLYYMSNRRGWQVYEREAVQS